MENLFKKYPLQDLLSSLNAVISINESTQFITGHVIYNLPYTYKFQLKTTLVPSYLCLGLGYALYYTGISMFCWMSVMCIDLCWTLARATIPR